MKKALTQMAESEYIQAVGAYVRFGSVGIGGSPDRNIFKKLFSVCQMDWSAAQEEADPKTPAGMASDAMADAYGNLHRTGKILAVTCNGRTYYKPGPAFSLDGD